MNSESPGSYFESKSVARMARFSAKFALAVMILGSAVRATDSGLACPDWPLCFGKPIPFFDTRIFLEWFHRLLAGIFALLVFYLGFRIVKSRDLRRQLMLPVVAFVLLLSWQIILGGLTVLELLDPHIVSWHLINAVMLYAVIEYTGIRAGFLQYRRLFPFEMKSYKLLVALRCLTVLVFVQILLGGMVSSNEAGLMCPGFPKCFGMWWPNISWLANLQMLHRFVAFAIVGYSVVLTALLMRKPLPPRVRQVVSLLPVMVSIQVLLGVLNVIWHLPVWASVAHLAVALLIFASTFIGTVEYQLFYNQTIAPERNGASQQTPSAVKAAR
jgi:cytochrome c oxidase assembly protein subunit 15